MKNLKALLITLLLVSVKVFSQPDDVLINAYWSFYSNNYLDATSSGKGNTGIGTTGNISAIQLNPASIDIPDKYQADVQYTYKTNQAWLPELNVDDLYLKNNIFSGSAAVGYRINKNFQVGFMYSNPKSMTLNIGEIIQTNEFGQEIGRYEAYEKYTSHSFSVPFVYSNKDIRLGIAVNYTLHRRFTNTNNDNEELVGKYNRFNLQAGIIVTPSKDFSIGATFTPDASGDVTYTGSVFYEEQAEAVLPMKIGAGAQYTFRGNFLRISGDYTYMNTAKVDYMRDVHQAHLGIEYLADKHWTVRTGFFTSPDVRDLSANYLNENESYNQIFLTLGTTYKIKKTSITLGIMDSHVSPGTLKYTFFNGGLTFNF